MHGLCKNFPTETTGNSTWTFTLTPFSVAPLTKTEKCAVSFAEKACYIHTTLLIYNVSDKEGKVL